MTPETIYNAIRGGLAGSTVMDAKAPMMMSRNFKPDFTINLHVKDLGNVMDTAQSVGSPTLLSSKVLEMTKDLQAHGVGSLDHSALAQYCERLTGNGFTA